MQLHIFNGRAVDLNVGISTKSHGVQVDRENKIMSLKKFGVNKFVDT